MGNCLGEQSSKKGAKTTTNSPLRQSFGTEANIFIKLKSSARVYSQQKQQDKKNNQKKFMNQLKKPQKERSKYMEISIIQENVLNNAKIQFYKYIKSICDQVLSDKSVFQPAKQQTHLYPKIKTIVELSQIVDAKFKTEALKLYQNYPKARKAQKIALPDQMKQEQKEMIAHFSVTLKPSQKMINEYMLDMCHRTALTLQELKKSGHNFSYRETH